MLLHSVGKTIAATELWWSTVLYNVYIVIITGIYTDIPNPLFSQKYSMISLSRNVMIITVDELVCGLSLLETLERILSGMRKVAWSAGTKLPTCAMMDSRITWRRKVDFPLMLGPGSGGKRFYNARLQFCFFPFFIQRKAGCTKFWFAVYLTLSNWTLVTFYLFISNGKSIFIILFSIMYN